ncbi:MAG: DUF4837 family protein [Flammeovirgaceae bacterium]
MKNLLWALPVIFFFACDGSKEEMLPSATGISGDIYLIMDSAQYKGPLGTLIDSIFRSEYLVINRPEPLFRMHWVDPRKLNYTLKLRRNLIYAVTLDQSGAGANRVERLLTAESINKIKTDTSFFFKAVTNQFAKGQQTFFLVGAREHQLMKNIRKNAARLVATLNKSEQERLTLQLFKSGTLKGLSENLKKKWGIDIQIPFGYQIVMNTDEFVWVRQFNKKDDRDIFVYKKQYTDPKQFERDSLVELRNSICKKYLYGDPEKPNSYLVTETSIPSKRVRFATNTLNGGYATSMNGLWKTNNLSMGGPFISYTVTDSKQSTLYYVEAFLYAPGREQRETMRELETILNTFKAN